MREFLLIAWLIPIGFFVWELAIAGQWHKKTANVKARTIRSIDVAFLVLIGLTMVYLYQS